MAAQFFFNNDMMGACAFVQCRVHSQRSNLRPCGFSPYNLFAVLCERLFYFYTQQHDKAKANADQQVAGCQGRCLKELLQKWYVGNGQLQSNSEQYGADERRVADDAKAKKGFATGTQG